MSPSRSRRAVLRAVPTAVTAAILSLTIALAACGDPPTSTSGSGKSTPSARVAAAADARTFRATLTSPGPAACPEGASGAEGTTPGSGALYLICVPASWNGSLVVYAHGYVQPFDPLAIHDDAVNGVKASQVVNGLGYAFATTSYRANGLIIFEAEKDLADLVHAFRRLAGPVPGHTIAVGASEGGLVVALATERHPGLFDGTLAACGPVGSFADQLAYLDDFRVLFDYFFPGVIPGSPIAVPDAVVEAWRLPVEAPGSLRSLVLGALAANPAATVSLLDVAGVTLPPGAPPELVGEAVLGLLNYNVLGSGDAQRRLGGQPYDNTTRVYPAPVDNSAVPRFTADPAALHHIEARYDTDGRLRTPLVTIHNLFDPVVPYGQEAPYGEKVARARAGDLLIQVPGDSLASPYGHCNFTGAEVLEAFSTLLSRIGEPELATR